MYDSPGASCIRVALLIVLLSINGCTTKLTKTSNVKFDMEKISKFQVELDIESPPVIRKSEGVRVKIKLTNNSQKTVYWGDVDGIEEFGIIVTTNQGNEEQKTERGEIRLGRGRSRPINHRYINTPLDPVSSKEWTVDLSDLYIWRSGRYHISATMAINSLTDEFFVAVKNVPLEIVP